MNYATGSKAKRVKDNIHTFSKTYISTEIPSTDPVWAYDIFATFLSVY